MNPPAPVTSTFFPDQFMPSARVVTLEQNYRSSQPILDAANRLIAESERQYRKTMGPVALYACEVARRVIHPAAGFVAGWISLFAGFTGAMALHHVEVASGIHGQPRQAVVPGADAGLDCLLGLPPA